jgi:hypothetical protein
MRRNLIRTFLVLGLFFFLTDTSFSQNPCKESGSIKRVKNRRIGKYEYVIFDLIKPDIAKYSVKTKKPPFTDYSGDETYKIKGRKFKVIEFRNLNWGCQTRESYSLPKLAIKGVKQLWVFEGIAEFVVGYRRRSRYIATYSYDAGSIRKVVMKFRR